MALSFTLAHLCDTPFCNFSRDNCATPHKNQGRQTGVGVQTGGLPGLDLSFLLVLFGTSRFLGGFSRFFGDFPDGSFFSFSAVEKHMQGTVPEESATQSGPFLKKWETPVWNPPGLPSLKKASTEWLAILVRQFPQRIF